MRGVAVGVGAVVAIALGGCLSHAHPRAPIGAALEADNAARIDSAIARAGAKLRDLAGPDGEFTYEYRLASGKPTGDYNIVRHGGAIYALAMFEHVAPDPKTRATIAATSHYLIARAVRPIGDAAPGVSAVFSIDTPGETGDDAALGATALGVVGLLAADELAPGSIEPATLRALGGFLSYMQRPDGSFFSTFTATDGQSTRFDSLYYPGEAVLALSRLFAWDHDARWRDAALRGMRFLAAARAESSDVPSDNWALIATADLIRQGGVTGADRAAFDHHANQIASVNLADQITDANDAIFGCYTNDGRTTPSSTHLEGLLAAATFLPRTDLRASIDEGVHFLLESQLPDGALPDDQHRRSVRIDFIQHALSAFIGYRELAAATGRGPVP